MKHLLISCLTIAIIHTVIPGISVCAADDVDTQGLTKGEINILRRTAGSKWDHTKQALNVHLRKNPDALKELKSNIDKIEKGGFPKRWLDTDEHDTPATTAIKETAKVVMKATRRGPINLEAIGKMVKNTYRYIKSKTSPSAREQYERDKETEGAVAVVERYISDAQRKQNIIDMLEARAREQERKKEAGDPPSLYEEGEFKTVVIPVVKSTIDWIKKHGPITSPVKSDKPELGIMDGILAEDPSIYNGPTGSKAIDPSMVRTLQRRVRRSNPANWIRAAEEEPMTLAELGRITANPNLGIGYKIDACLKYQNQRIARAWYNPVIPSGIRPPGQINRPSIFVTRIPSTMEYRASQVRYQQKQAQARQTMQALGAFAGAMAASSQQQKSTYIDPREGYHAPGSYGRWKRSQGR